MAPLNSSAPSRRSSSGSTTPPSETTLAEDPLFPDASSAQSSWHNNFHQHGQTDTNPAPQANNSNVQQYKEQQRRPLTAINTDYESSAAEDSESYTTNKYENAEFALLSYSRTNKSEKLQRLLEAKLLNDVKLDINFRGQQKQNFSWSALHLACYFGHIRIVELLLSKKYFKDEIDINLQNNSGDTPLHKAALTNRIQIVQILLANGADVFIKNSDGMLAKKLTTDRHVLDMLNAAEQVDRNRIKQEMFEAVDRGDLMRLQGYFDGHKTSMEAASSDQNETAGEGESAPELEPRIEGQDQYFDRIVDDRGNTLLHVAAMRGYRAICIYLLERGLDPYKLNSAGQTCIDLSSYQLRQLFTTVKPTEGQLKKFSRQRIIRFEGPLLKKVRILGWKQIHVVLENGVILLFNNRKDSMNKSRRGYKYLESATCHPEPNDLGMFTVVFSDRSRATFLVNSGHLSSYSTFKAQQHDMHAQAPASQVELIRQKWIDSIRDHIEYSTNFIKNGLQLNEDEDENDLRTNNGDLASLNHLLPIDTIKSFIHEARAHHSILERHAESLCGLVQSISATSGRPGSSIDVTREHVQRPTEMQAPSSRLLGFIRSSSRNSQGSSPGGGDENATPFSSSAALSEAKRKRDSLQANEFVRDNWHCILFHLRLLMESTENTKSSMSQALALMEHQEQLRQNRMQDQEERCRILEESLHALARDHHELEKSLSISQIYHSATGRSVSMSTDLNEYFDAFDDFDDEKTVTPNSMPSDEDLHRKIQDIIDDENEANNMNHKLAGALADYQKRTGPSNNHGGDDTDMDDEEDLESNCSALTVETVSERTTNNQGLPLLESAIEAKDSFPVVEYSR